MSRNKANVLILDLPATPINAGAVTAAGDDVVTWYGNVDPLKIKRVLQGLNLAQLRALTAKIETITMQEAAISQLTGYFMETYNAVKDIETTTKKTLNAMDATFEYVYLQGYFLESGNFDHSSFLVDIEHALVAAEAIDAMDV